MAVVWSSQYNEQLAIMRNLKNRINLIEQATVPATFIGTDLPNQTDINQVWQNKGLGTAPAQSKVQWYDPTQNRIRNILYQLDQAVAEPLQQPFANMTEVVDVFTVTSTSTPVTIWSNTNFTKQYRSLIVMGMVSTDNSTVPRVLQMRFNSNTAVLNWSYTYYEGNQTPAGVAGGLDNQNSVILTNVQSSTAANVIPFTFTYFTVEFFYPYLAAPNGFFFNTTTGLTDLTAATSLVHRWGGGVLANSTVVTNLTFLLSLGNFSPGSKIIVIGQNPR